MLTVVLLFSEFVAFACHIIIIMFGPEKHVHRLVNAMFPPGCLRFFMELNSWRLQNIQCDMIDGAIHGCRPFARSANRNNQHPHA